MSAIPCRVGSRRKGSAQSAAQLLCDFVGYALVYITLFVCADVSAVVHSVRTSVTIITSVVSLFILHYSH